MTGIEGLAHIGIRVNQFDRTVAFYRRFGFALVREDFRERVMVLRHPSGLELNLLDSATTGNCAGNILMDVQVRYPGITHLALRVPDIAAVGIAITEGPVTFGDGSTSIFIRDPDRNVIELSQPGSLPAANEELPS